MEDKNSSFTDSSDKKFSFSFNKIYLKKIFFLSIYFNFFSVKIANITLDPDLNWAKSQDPDSNSMDSIWIHNTNFT